MAEYPSDKPTQVVLFATDETNNSEPSSGVKADGYANNALLAAAQYNWMMWALSHVLDWTRSLAVRQFDNLYEAIDAEYASDSEEPGNPFYLRRSPQGWATPAQTRSCTGTALMRLCTDGRLFFYTDGQLVRGAPNRLTGAAAVTWAYDASTEGGIDALRMDCDGVVVVIANGTSGSPPSVVVVTAAGDDGGMLFEDSTTGVACWAVAADSLPGAARVWWGTSVGGSAAKVRVWNGSAADALTGLEPVRCIAACENFVCVGHGEGTDAQIDTYNKTSATTLSILSQHIATGIPQTRAQSVCCDGEYAYWAIDGAGGSAPPTIRAIALSDSTTAAWTVTGPTNYSFGTRLKCLCDDRYVYVTMYFVSVEVIYILEKRTGKRVGMLATGASIEDFCIDGLHVFVSDGGADLDVFCTGRQPGIWARRGLYEEHRAPMHGMLAMPTGK